MMHSRIAGPRGAAARRVRALGTMVLLAGLLGAVAGCGQSGPLSLPEGEASAAVDEAGSAPAVSRAYADGGVRIGGAG